MRHEDGRVLPPYGGCTRCADSTCQARLDEEAGAYLFTDRTTGKLVVFCGDCALRIDLHDGVRFARGII